MMMDLNQLKTDVQTLATPQGRRVGTSGHEAARRYLVSRLTELGLEGYRGGLFELPYQYDGQSFANLVAQLPGRNPELPPVLLAAHYDTCGDIPGADDNAAAVAVLLAAAEELRGQPLERRVLCAFFDAEEPPHFLHPSMGSIHFYEQQRQEPVHCAIIMDLVGHDVPVPGLQDLLFITGMESDPNLASVVKDCEPTAIIRTVPTLNRYVGDLSDHYIFRVNKRPYLFLSCGHWEHYHRYTDTPDRLNYGKIGAIAKYVCGLTERICQTSLKGPFEGYDSTEAELYFLRKTVQPFLDRIGLGLKLGSRKDIDRLVQLMMRGFGL